MPKHSPTPSRAQRLTESPVSDPEMGWTGESPTGQPSVICGAANGIRLPSPLGSPAFHSVDQIIANVRRTGGGREADGLESPLGAPQTGHKRSFIGRFECAVADQ